MRIDLNPSSAQELARSNGSAAAAQAAQPGASTQPKGRLDDVAQLSTGSDAIQNLKTQLNAVPEVRQQLVESLQQSISNGSFQVSPQHIAGAMLRDGTRSSGK
jgi:flagellar biosynthesis anti-sigma factor FlgM